MSGQIERAKLFTVSGPIDSPERGSTEVSVMFNPTTLKVTLANSLKENERGGNSRAAQYVDKSSSSLSVELIFDSSLDIDQGTVSEAGKLKEIDISRDVRKYTGAIANEFMKQADVGDDDVEPKRCMFVWGTFVFVGIMESFDETLDFFSWEGTPLRATVSIKMTESRFQFISEAAKQASRNTPTLGANSDTPHKAARAPKEWRDTSTFNGVESPRMPSSSGLSMPSASASANLSASLGVSGGVGFSAGASAGIGGGIGGGIGMGAGANVGMSAGMSAGISASASVNGGVNAAAMMKSTPAFNFGASSSIGTNIPGAFSPNTKNRAGLTAGSILAVSVSANGVRSNTSVIGNNSASARTNSANTKVSARTTGRVGPTGIKASGSLGFD